MRVAFVVGGFPVLSETFILDQITGIIELGHEVEIFSRTIPDVKKVHPDVKNFGLIQKTHYVPVPAGGKLRWRLKSLLLLIKGCLTRPFSTIRLVRRLLAMQGGFSHDLFQLSMAMTKNRFDIIHCHFATLGLVAINLKDIGVQSKFITAFHGYDVNKFPLEAGPDVYKKLFAQCDLYTANTNYTKGQAVDLGCDPDRIEILPEGLRVEKFLFNTRHLKPNSKVKVLTVGRLVEKKGYEYSIPAIGKLIKQGYDIEYNIVGDGSLKEKLQKLVDDLSIRSNVIFKGDLNQTEVLKLYQDCHVFILSSVTASTGDKEGQALVLQEAQATGMPVISTFHNGIPDGVLDGKSGFLVEERDIDGLAEKVQILIDTPDMIAEFGKTGRKFVEKRYDINLLNKRVEGFYQKLVTSQRL